MKNIITIVLNWLFSLALSFFFSPFLIRCALVALNRYIPSIPIIDYWDCVVIWWAVKMCVPALRPKIDTSEVDIDDDD